MGALLRDKVSKRFAESGDLYVAELEHINIYAVESDHDIQECVLKKN